MSIFRFPPASVISEATFRHAHDRPPVALLSARDGIGEDEVAAIRGAMNSGGWQAIPVSINGKEVLQVSGFEREEQCLRFMQEMGFSQGQPVITSEPGDNPEVTATSWVQSNTLKIGGALNMIGDAALLTSGFMSGRIEDKVAGALYTGGAAVAARYGNVKTEHHLREVSERTAKFLKEQAAIMPEDCGLFSILKDKREGTLHNMERVLYRYPSEVMLGAYTMGALTMLKSGIRQRDPYGIGYGISSVACKAASLAIDEKHLTPEQKKAHEGQPIVQMMDWLREKPLRIFGFGSLVTDTLLGLSAYHEYKHSPKQKSYIFKFITTGTYMIADIMFALSHKSHVNGGGKFDAEEQRSIEALAAETISRQPKDMQPALVNQVAGFLATQREMQGNGFEIAAAIRDQLEHMHRNPWACRTADTMLPQAGLNR